jgi:hypothetical protein
MHFACPATTHKCVVSLPPMHLWLGPEAERTVDGCKESDAR